MILSDTHIKDGLEKEYFAISSPNFIPDEQIRPSGVDLRLGREFFLAGKPALLARFSDWCSRTWRGEPDDALFERRSRISGLDLSDLPNQKKYLTQVCASQDATGVWLEPGQFVLGSTEESIRIGPNHCAFVNGRSSLGRLGLFVHVTAGFVDPGFEGKITLEFLNIIKYPLWIPFTTRICQLILANMSSPVHRTYDELTTSKYHKATGPQASRISDDFPR